MIYALTICQPYASLICLPASDRRHKRVENRTWSTSYRGPLLIHAGKSKQFLWLEAGTLRDARYGLGPDDMPMGAFVGIARLVDCVPILYQATPRRLPVVPFESRQKYPWLQAHAHTEGPVCWVLEDVRKFAAPVPTSGSQGLWYAPLEQVRPSIEATGFVL